MSQESYPGASSDIPDPVEPLPIYSYVKRELLEVGYHDDAAQFKHDILSTLMQHAGWEDGGLLWSVYSLPVTDSTGSEAYYTRHDILVMADFRENHKQSDDPAIPIIRIITNEFLRFEDKAFCVARDYLLDEDGDSQYCVDSARIRLHDDMTSKQERTYAPIFYVDFAHKLYLGNYQIMTPVLGVPSPDDDGVFIKPFGDFTDPIFLMDRIYNLEIGREIFSQVDGLKPDVSSKAPKTD